MKRIKAACLQQTVHFQLKEDLPHQVAVEMVRAEYERYQQQLDKSRTQYKIVDEQIQSDGSIIIKIKKQYNTSPVGEYLD